MPPGTTLPTVIAAGVSITPMCSTVVMDRQAQFTIQPAAISANDLSTSGLLLQTVGVTKTPTSIFGTGGSSFEPSATSAPGNAAVATFEGVVRPAPGPGCDSPSG